MRKEWQNGRYIRQLDLMLDYFHACLSQGKKIQTCSGKSSKFWFNTSKSNPKLSSLLLETHEVYVGMVWQLFLYKWKFLWLPRKTLVPWEYHFLQQTFSRKNRIGKWFGRIVESIPKPVAQQSEVWNARGKLCNTWVTYKECEKYLRKRNNSSVICDTKCSRGSCTESCKFRARKNVAQKIT